MNVNLEDGWVPRRLLYQGDEPIVQLVRRQHGPLTKPVFYQDLFGCREKIHLPLRDFDWLHDSDMPDRPSGFVFHMSRCGSTLVGRMLGALERCVVLLEPYPLTEIFSSPCPVAPMEQIARLRTLIAIYIRGMVRPGQSLFIKWTSWTVVRLGLVQRAFPGVPTVFIYRDPVEVMVSVLRDPPGWLRTKEAKPQLLGVSAKTAVRIPDVEFCAGVLARFCFAAARAPEPVVAVSYEDLPEAVWVGVGRVFGLDINVVDQQKMAAAVHFHSKTLRQLPVFTPDGDSKQQRGTVEMKALAKRIVAPAISELVARRIRTRQASGDAEAEAEY